MGCVEGVELGVEEGLWMMCSWDTEWGSIRRYVMCLRRPQFEMGNGRHVNRRDFIHSRSEEGTRPYINEDC